MVTTMRLPLVSVCMPVYNGERFVAGAIESILSQTLEEFEFLILDDGSTDGSLGIMRRYAERDARIRVISRANTGIVGALNEMIGEARGELIARMDADDVSRPDRFERQVRYLKENPDCVLVGSRVLVIDSDGDPLVVLPTPLSHEEIENGLLNFRGQLIHHPSTMIRLRSLLEIGGYRPECREAEDLDLFLRLAEIGRIANLAEPLLNYREHSGKSSVVRAEAFASNVFRIVEEARRRRGLEPAAESMLEKLKLTQDMGTLHRTWGWWALGAGRVSVARKHARVSLAMKPCSLSSWRLALCALRGH
jgi:glycosyltransferase involved in cell wall biosynthesis